MLIDRRATRPGEWLMFSIYKHDTYWRFEKRYIKTPFFFLSHGKSHFEIGICIGKISITLHKHFGRPKP